MKTSYTPDFCSSIQEMNKVKGLLADVHNLGSPFIIAWHNQGLQAGQLFIVLIAGNKRAGVIIPKKLQTG